MPASRPAARRLRAHHAEEDLRRLNGVGGPGPAVAAEPRQPRRFRSAPASSSASDGPWPRARIEAWHPFREKHQASSRRRRGCSPPPRSWRGPTGSAPAPAEERGVTDQHRRRRRCGHHLRTAGDRHQPTRRFRQGPRLSSLLDARPGQRASRLYPSPRTARGRLGNVRQLESFTLSTSFVNAVAFCRRSGTHALFSMNMAGLLSTSRLHISRE
jgi:hypothetical protein